MPPVANKDPLTESQWALVTSIDSLMWKLARRFTPPSISRNESYVQESYDFLFDCALRSARSYDAKLGFAFTTYFCFKIRTRLFSYWRERKEVCSINESICAGAKITHSDGIAAPVEIEHESEVDCLSPLRYLSERERLVVEHWHGLNGRERLGRAKVGKVIGTSGSRAWQIYDAAIRKLRLKIIK